ncbi:MAG: endonuclease [Candidatus Micrarchaeota archaeon]|nr:endonuclease [Candidatus Micrarchaeota archaeon]
MRTNLYDLYARLRERFGYLDWWPGDTADEIVIGAVLTQQTAWTNVEKAIANLKRERLLSIAAISRAKVQRLERCVRPSGYYRQKARRLKGISARIMDEYGSLDGLLSLPGTELRKTLLGFHGIGKETADSIVLYAANKMAFVVDAYTIRAMSRIYGMDSGTKYDDMQRYFTDRLRPSIRLYKDMHAQFVELGKNYCRTRPLCADCPANRICAYSRNM